jgi:hypothetical protein
MMGCDPKKKGEEMNRNERREVSEYLNESI